MDKLDERLASRQIAWLADLATEIDRVQAADLRQGGPTLGAPAPITGAGAAPKSSSHPAQCGPHDTFSLLLDGSQQAAGAPQVLTVRYYGRRHRLHGIRVELNVNHGALHHVIVELRHRGRLMAHGRVRVVGTRRHRMALRRPHGQKFPHGHYTLVVRRAGRKPARRSVRVG